MQEPAIFLLCAICTWSQSRCSQLAFVFEVYWSHSTLEGDHSGSWVILQAPLCLSSSSSNRSHLCLQTFSCLHEWCMWKMHCAGEDLESSGEHFKPKCVSRALATAWCGEKPPHHISSLPTLSALFIHLPLCDWYNMYIPYIENTHSHDCK